MQLPDWLWIVIACVGGPAIIALIAAITWQIFKGNFHAKIAGQEISLKNNFPGSEPEVGCSDETQANYIRKLEGMLTEVYTEIKDIILQYMVSIGIPKNSLANNGDYNFIMSLVWQVIYGKNGKRSVRTILEDAILREVYSIPKDITHREYVEMRTRGMRGIIPQIDGEMRNLIEDKYDNLYTVFDVKSKSGKELERAITMEKLGELLKAYTRDKLSPAVEVLFYDDVLDQED